MSLDKWPLLQVSFSPYTQGSEATTDFPISGHYTFVEMKPRGNLAVHSLHIKNLNKDRESLGWPLTRVRI